MHAAPAAVAFICSGLLVCTGCATNPGLPASQPESEVPTVRSITLALRPMPGMEMVTPGPAAAGAVTGLLGYAITASEMTKEGNAIVQKYQVDDPAVAIGNSLRDQVAANDRMVAKDSAGVRVTSLYIRDVAKAYPGSSEILDVRTTEWVVMYLPFDFMHYGVQYGVEATLYDARKHEVLASATCSHDPKRSDGAPTHEELLENNAAQLKILSAKAAERCVAEILPRLLGRAK
ncbi:MAG TPA: hypothetical protein VF931_08045 [Steroidobacteraceae bacterium]